VQYLIMAMETAEEFAEREDPERGAEYWAGWGAYLAALSESGVMTGTGGLHPPATSTTVRLRDGQRVVHDGPFADTKEQLGGYFVIDVPDLDAALEWAARCPAAARGAVEVRPLMTPEYYASTGAG
jgi:hypothetical protein